LLPPDYKCGDAVPAAGVWPENVLQHPLVRLARKRQENIDHFEAHQGDAIKTVLDQMGYRSHAQALSACPALSDAGTPAAFAALDPQIVQGYMTSRGIDEAQHDFLRMLLGDFELYQRRIGREQKRQQKFDELHEYTRPEHEYSRFRPSCNCEPASSRHRSGSKRYRNMHKPSCGATQNFSCTIHPRRQEG
jgi:hypothetical protein